MFRRKILTLIFLFFSFFAVSAQEATDVPADSTDEILSLRQIDKYINDVNKRDFQTALLELNKYLSAHPEQFDAVQRRYKKILGSRDRYVELANELMRLIRESSEEDSERIDEQMMRLTDRILALERNPGHEELEIVKDTNYLVSIRQYSAIQNKTASLVASEDYVKASQKAQEGFSILRENFNARYEGQEVARKVDSSIATISALLEQYRLLQERLKTAVNQYETFINADNPSGALGHLSVLSSTFLEFSKIRNSILENGIVLLDCSNIIARNTAKNKKIAAESDEDKFLKHADEYLGLAVGTVFGWKDNPHPDHGLLGVLDAQWNVYVEHLKDITAKAMNKRGVEFCELSSVQAFRQNGTLPDKSKLEKINVYSKCAKNVNALYGLLKTRDGKSNLKSYPNYDISIDYLNNIAIHTEETVDNVLTVAGIKQKADVIQDPSQHGQSELEGSNFVSSLFAVSQEIYEVQRNMKSNSSGNAAWGSKYRELYEKQIGALPVSETRETSGVFINDKILIWDKIENTSTEYIAATDEYAEKSVSDIYVRVAKHFASCGSDYVAKAVSDNSAIQQKIAGSQESGGKKYPKAAVQDISALNAYITSSKKVLVSSSSKLGGRYSESYQDSTISINNSIAELDRIFTQNTVDLNSANDLIRNANKNVSDAEKAMANAQKLYRNKKYDEARQAANDALDLWRESLKYNYDSSLDENSEKNVIALLGDIAEQQKILIENEVNNLVAQANKEYRNDNYTKAQNSLNQALERWNVIYPDFENYEISNLKVIVENALSANSGREVLPSDSLYLDVSQMLRSANQSFEKGQSLSKKGKVEESNLQFEDALSTLEVLRSLVPRNQAANILRLKIQQFQNPAEFESNFADRVQTAKADAKDKTKMLQAYSDLCDLQKIRPNYPGLEAAVIELEYALGKRDRPIDNSTKKEAASLLAQAKSLYNKGNYSQAFAKVNQAIGKDNTNAEARVLRSQINKRMQTTVSVRSPDLEDRYQEALEYSNSSEYAKANDIVIELWKNPANRIEKLEKLKARIERWM